MEAKEIQNTEEKELELAEEWLELEKYYFKKH